MCRNRDEDRDARLVLRARAGHVPARDQLVRVHDACIPAVVARMLRNRYDQDDACQETWVRTFPNLSSLKKEGRFCPWACQIAANVCLGVLRATSKRPNEPAINCEPPASEGPERQELDREFKKRIRDMVERLSPTSRELIVMRYFYQMPSAIMARALGLRPGTLRRRLSHALAECRRDPLTRELARDLDWNLELIDTGSFRCLNTDRSVVISLRLVAHVRLVVQVLLRRRIVRRLIDAPRRAGWVSYFWDGKNDRGVHLSSGDYVVRVHARDANGNAHGWLKALVTLS